MLDSFRIGLLSALALAATACSVRELSFVCNNPQPASGTDHGYVRCDGGWSHRPEALECPDKRPPGNTCSDGFGGCSVDAECDERPYGSCQPAYDEGCYCNYGCRVDADCDEGYICVCGEVIGQCTPATCTVDADCGDALCASFVESPGCPGDAFACQTEDDECVSSADCPEGQTCSFPETAEGVGPHRVCMEPSCAVGRPFLVAGDPRLAPPTGRADWRVDAIPSLAGLDARERADLADHWTRAGLMEHASIAAFARFALQLLAVGAPAQLLRDAQAAMADELEHARICFAFAGAYAGRDLGPGALDVAGALAGDLREFVVTAILEGCVGETVAALEARESAAHADDPVVRAALERIAADETRHAELAWRFVQWALARDPALCAVADATFAAAVADAPPPPADAGDELLRRGVLGRARAARLRRAVLTTIVGPCAGALLARSREDAGAAAPTLAAAC